MSYNKFPWTNFHGFNLDWVIETVQQCKSLVDGIVEEVNNIFSNYVTKNELTNNRKLSENGDFSGTWKGNTFESLKLKNGDFSGTWKGDSKEKIDGLILNGQNLYENVIDLINSNPELNIEIFDGSFLANATPPTVIDLGLISEAVTEEIDCGFFVYPCAC